MCEEFSTCTKRATYAIFSTYTPGVLQSVDCPTHTSTQGAGSDRRARVVV